jgi:hypothetical protein
MESKQGQHRVTSIYCRYAPRTTTTATAGRGRGRWRRRRRGRRRLFRFRLSRQFVAVHVPLATHEFVPGGAVKCQRPPRGQPPALGVQYFTVCHRSVTVTLPL